MMKPAKGQMWYNPKSERSVRVILIENHGYGTTVVYSFLDEDKEGDKQRAYRLREKKFLRVYEYDPEKVTVKLTGM